MVGRVMTFHDRQDRRASAQHHPTRRWSRLRRALGWPRKQLPVRFARIAVPLAAEYVGRQTDAILVVSIAIILGLLGFAFVRGLA